MKCLLVVPEVNSGALAYGLEFAEALEERGYELEASGNCLCERADLSEYSLIMFHPHTINIQGFYMDRPECVKSINAQAESNPNIGFLVLAVNNKERSRNYPLRKNLAVITHAGIDKFTEALDSLFD